MDSRGVLSSMPDEVTIVLAPTTGTVLALNDVPDPVFGQGVLGLGCAVEPERGSAVAPVSGTVAAAMPHAAAIDTPVGAQVLVHAGGRTDCGFAAHVVQGQPVRALQPLLSWDAAAVEAAGLAGCVVVVASGATEVELLAKPGDRVGAGDPLLAVRV